MTWTNISDESSNWAAPIGIELINSSPDFEDPSDPSIEVLTIGPTNTVISNGQYIAGSTPTALDSDSIGNGSILSIYSPFVIGETIYYSIDVDYYNGGLFWIQLPGILIWDGDIDSAGLKSGTVTITRTQPIYNIYAQNSSFAINHIYFWRKPVPDYTSIADKTSSWTDTSTSSSWTPLTDKTTVWS